MQLHTAAHARDSEPDSGIDTCIQSRSPLRHLTTAGKARARLVVLAGPGLGDVLAIPDGVSVIGRGDDADIRIGERSVSRRHARLDHSDGAVVIEDLGSSNGTFVNGELARKTVLRDGDKILLGASTILRFNLHDDIDSAYQRRISDALSRDQATGAFNKRHFLDHGAAELAFARRHGTPVSVVLFDIDTFKKVNDTFGHLAGDHVLAQLVALVSASLRPEDVLARCGGDEFGIVLRGISTVRAALLAERIRLQVSLQEFRSEGKRIPLTISMGVAGYPDTVAATIQELVTAADAALYEAKRGGRNRVELPGSAAATR